MSKVNGVCGRRLGISVVGAVSALVIVGAVAAMTVNTDSWNCGWSASTNWSGSGAVSTTAADSCAAASAVQMDYYAGGSWHSRSYVYGSTYASDSVGSTTEVFSRHQIGVTGHGWGQEEYTWVP